MGIQPKNMPLEEVVQAKASSLVKGAQAAKRVPLWNKLPQLLNLVRYQMKPAQPSEDMLDYEPIHLHITPCDLHPIVAALQSRMHAQTGGNTAEFDTTSTGAQSPVRAVALDNFRFLMDQVPAVRTIEFSGKTDPLRNAELIRMVEHAYRFNGAETTIHTDGFLLNMFTDEIVKSRLRTLVVHLYGHKPSGYAMMSGQSPSRFLTIRDNVQRLVQRKRALGAHVEIEISMTVDLHNFREIPDMIRFAEELGVDGIRFENYLSPEAGAHSDRSLYSNQKPVQSFLREVSADVAQASRLSVTLPTLLEPDMSEARNCLDPYTTVSVDAEFNVSGCSRQMLFRGKMSKIWDQDFWNSDLYKWLRNVHGSGVTEAEKADVPKPCRACPRNMACK